MYFILHLHIFRSSLDLWTIEKQVAEYAAAILAAGVGARCLTAFVVTSPLISGGSGGGLEWRERLFVSAAWYVYLCIDTHTHTLALTHSLTRSLSHTLTHSHTHTHAHILSGFQSRRYKRCWGGWLLGTYKTFWRCIRRTSGCVTHCVLHLSCRFQVCVNLNLNPEA